MFLKNANTNVFETDLEEQLIEQSRQGKLALASAKSKAFFQRKKNELQNARLRESSMEVIRQEVTLSGVDCRFQFEVGSQTIERNISVIVDGEWKPGSIRSVINLNQDAEAITLAEEIAEEASLLSGSTHYDENGKWVPISKRVLEQIKSSLAVDAEAANTKLVAEVNKLIRSDEFKKEAYQAFEDSIREEVFEALEIFQKVPPESMHRFVDELYCKKIHDS